jgi:hypothetical protein
MTRADPRTRAMPGQPVRPKLRASRGAASPPADGRCPPADDGFPALPKVAGRSCRGAVTAEFAVALPAVVLLLALLLAGSAAGVTQLRLEEAARAGARALARGDSAAGVQAIVRRLAGQTAGSAVTSEGEWIGITVSGRAPGALGSLLPWTFSAGAWARRESSRAAGFARAEALPPHRAGLSRSVALLPHRAAGLSG